MSASVVKGLLSYHKGILCDFCLKEDFQGKRYKCCRCFSYDLCESCFTDNAFNKNHLLSHPMLCILTQKDYNARLKLLTKLVDVKSFGTYEKVYFDIPEVYAKTKSTKLNLVILASNQTSNSAETQAGSPDNSNQQSSDKGTYKLAQDFEKLFFDGSGCDITFDVKGTTLNAHKAVLMARSPTFSGMFRHNTAEAKSRTVVITDFEPEAFQAFIAYLYSAKVDQSLLKRLATALYGLADKYFVGDLKQLCLEWMKGNIDTDNFCDILYLAVKHGDSDLLSCTKEYFSKNMKRIVVTQKWKDFNRENPDEANELLISALNVDG